MAIDTATVWQFEKYDGLWEDMATSFSKQLSAAVSKGDDTVMFVAKLIIDEQLVLCQYECDFIAMVQHNLTTEKTRKMRAIRIVLEENRGAPTLKRGSGSMDSSSPCVGSEGNIKACRSVPFETRAS